MEFAKISRLQGLHEIVGCPGFFLEVTVESGKSC